MFARRLNEMRNLEIIKAVAQLPLESVERSDVPEARALWLGCKLLAKRNTEVA